MTLDELRAKAFVLTTLGGGQATAYIRLADAEAAMAECKQQKERLRKKLRHETATTRKFAAEFDRKLAAAREALELAQKYGNFDPHSDQTIIRAIAAVLTEAGERPEGEK